MCAAVEVGVHQGAFSQHILQHWNGSMLHLVDPWGHGGPYSMDRDADLQLTRSRVAPFEGRSASLRGGVQTLRRCHPRCDCAARQVRDPPRDVDDGGAEVRRRQPRLCVSRCASLVSGLHERHSGVVSEGMRDRIMMLR
jgi:hypothetical protein